MGRFLSSRFFYGLYLLLAVLLLLEVGLRIYFASEIGPRVLAYGTPWYRAEFGDRRQQRITRNYERELEAWEQQEAVLNTVYSQDNTRGGYRKFFPNEAKFHRDIDTSEVFPITINSQGFRGEEFTREKPEGVIRILTLGASSTFGFFNREDETYPHQLEVMLNQRCPGPEQFEVINFAIPRSVTDEILAMFVAEGIALDPDVITFYEGRNDSDQVHPLGFVGGEPENGGTHGNSEFLQEVWDALSQHLMVAGLVERLWSSRIRISAQETTQRLDRIATRTSQAFLVDLEQIREIAARRGILFIVANQQSNSKSWFGLPQSERMALKGVTYQDEIDHIHALVDQGESISGYEFNFLVHDRLMHDLEAWARRRGLAFVDIIELLDRQRHHLLSYVHLHPHANRLIAVAFADEILRHACAESQR